MGRTIVAAFVEGELCIVQSIVDRGGCHFKKIAWCQMEIISLKSNTHHRVHTHIEYRTFGREALARCRVQSSPRFASSLQIPMLGSLLKCLSREMLRETRDYPPEFV